MTVLYLDFETRSTVDLRKAGVYVYANDPTTDVILACWAEGEGPVETWFNNQPVPARLKELLADETVRVVAHNAGFERNLLNSVLARRYGWPEVRIERWDDTAARAARQSLPRSLEGAANALGLSVQKDTEGRALMLRMCRPRAVNPDGSIVWWEDAARMQRLAEYCATDVEVERQLDHVLRPLPKVQHEQWCLTETINDRGLLLDVPFIQRALRASDRAQVRADEEISALTGGMVPAATNVIKIKAWLKGHGFQVLDSDDESLAKKAIENILARQDLPADVRRVLEIRLEAGKSSVKKLDAMWERTSADDRVRGNFLWHGASTGRYAGAGVQVQNLPRNVVKDWEAAAADIENASLGDLSRMLRGTIMAAPGHRLMWADYASVEARGVAWLAGARELTDLFATGGKVYETMAAKIVACKVDEVAKDSLERQLGKTVVLGAGYGMGAAKFRLTCAAQGMDVSEDLAQQAIRAYREGFPEIPAMWRGLENAAMSAVRRPNTDCEYIAPTKAAKIVFRVQDGWLLCRLPSGRLLFYADPQIINIVGPFGEREVLQYWAVNSLTKKWETETTWGGKLCENVVQGICADLILAAMLRLEHKLYAVVATVHDEVVCELPDGFGTIDEMLKLMCATPEWALGFPIAAEAKESKRYGK